VSTLGREPYRSLVVSMAIPPELNTLPSDAASFLDGKEVDLLWQAR
jgi:hypothetical protein